jgi:phosphohistidine phosphatase
MQVLVIRHAIAEDRVEFAKSGKSDNERPLTAEGKRRMERAASGLRELVPTIDVVASSPLVRAKQTADIVAAAYGGKAVEIVPALSGDGNLKGVVAWLGSQDVQQTVALVGHEPDLGMLVSYLLTDTTSMAIALKKGAVCLLEFDAPVEPGAATLRWFLAPKQLRAIGDAGA